MLHYPRDLAGYGRDVPQADWPGGARLALQFVVNYEEGGERCVLHGDAESEAFLSDIVDAQPVAGARHISMESLYEYGSRAGFWRLLRLFERPFLYFPVHSNLNLTCQHFADFEYITFNERKDGCYI